MSPRAAWRLEALGFSKVYDYVPGKSDWLAYDLPYEGEAVLAGRAVDRDVPTCRVSEQVGEVRERLDDGGLCVVLNDADVVMGVVRSGDLEGHDDHAVDEVMRFGTTTVRPSEDLEALLGRMREADVDVILVTRSDGTLVGVLDRSQAERVP